jgi:hypothetical protein
VTNVRRWVSSAGAAVAIAAGGGFALLPASPALAFFSGGLFLDVVPQSPANLVANGAAVDVPVEVTCNATGTTFLHVNLTEKVGKKIASGDSFTDVTCSGAHQRILVRVTANSGGQAFAKGKAVASADISGCNNVTCGQETGSATITLKK